MSVDDRVSTYMHVAETHGTVGLTADELALALGLSVLTVRPAVTRLVKSKVLYRSRERRINASGRTAAVVMIAP